MIMKLLVGGACIAALALPLAAQAQGVPGGAVHWHGKSGRLGSWNRLKRSGISAD
jgi:hypothetical protein